MQTSRIRLKDIAVATGFSVNTVSLALRSSKRIPQETTELILKAAERLEYRPNHVARSLVNRATHTIGLVLTDIMNPTLTLAARTIERRLDECGYSMMFAASDNIIASEIKALEVLRSHQVDGMLIYPTSRRHLEHIRPLRRAGYPVVLLGPDRDAGLDVVAVDDRRGAFKAVDHLLGLGHERIGFLDAAGPLGNTDKHEGYEQALRRHKVPLEPKLVVDPGGHGAPSGYAGMAALMKKRIRPTAVFTATDNLAIGVLAWCRDHGLRVPDDVSIVGYDNIEASEFAEIPLTTINYAADKVSEIAIERLLALIGNQAQTPTVTLIEPDLIIRRSSGPVAGKA
jgi:LacI family transcriptional regulator